MMRPKKPQRPLSQYAKFSGILFQMIAIIGIGAYAGIKLDEKYPNAYSAYTTLLVTIAVVVSIYATIKQIIRRSKEDE